MRRSGNYNMPSKSPKSADEREVNPVLAEWLELPSLVAPKQVQVTHGVQHMHVSTSFRHHALWKVTYQTLTIKLSSTWPHTPAFRCCCL